MFLIRPPNKEKTKCCAVMTHFCTKMKQKGAATNEISKSEVVQFSIYSGKKLFNNFLECVELA